MGNAADRDLVRRPRHYPGLPAQADADIGPAKLVATSANGQPAFAVYARGGDGVLRPHALHVLTVTAEGVSRIVAFHGSALFPLFGL